MKFLILGDGKLLWESEVLKPGKTVQYEINITGVNKLSLLTDDGGDGRSSDWGLWLEPVLRR